MTQTPLTPGEVPAARPRVPWLVAGLLVAAALSAAGGVAVHRINTAAPAEEVIEPARVGQAVPRAEGARASTKATAPGSPAPAPTPAAGERVAAASVCAQCGVVESVRPVTRKGEASGVGAVAGGVLGAVVGNQIGKGNGRTAMTAIGAVGGGLAGHEIEKRSKSTTVYEVGVRMDDGSLRTVEQATAPRSGERVRLEGKTLKPIA